jgi:hypothetical protein
MMPLSCSTFWNVPKVIVSPPGPLAWPFAQHQPDPQGPVPFPSVSPCATLSTRYLHP